MQHATIAMNDQPVTLSNSLDPPLLLLLEQALSSSVRQRELLKQPETLGKILNTVSARRWIFEVACQTENRHRSTKARALILLIMQHSGKIWRGQAASIDDYNEAHARTLKWFGENLYRYDPTIASFVTWFNNKLKFVMVDVAKERIQREQQERSLEFGFDAQTIELADPKPSAIEAKIFYEQVIELIKRDPGNTLRNCHMQHHLNVTCQRVILEILQALPISPNIPWEALARQFGVNPASLRSFCKNTAFPHFLRFCQRNGIYHL